MSVVFPLVIYIPFINSINILRLPGPPLTQNNSVGVLLANNVKVALGSMPMWPWTARNLRFDIAWVRDIQIRSALKYSCL